MKPRFNDKDTDGSATKAAIYCRVSTSDQHNEIQVRELTEYLKRRGWKLVGCVFRAIADQRSEMMAIAIPS